MSDALEKVAREIGPAMRATILRGGANSHEEIDAFILGFARAAIKAIREPTDEMAIAGEDALRDMALQFKPRENGETVSATSALYADACFKAMIDAILKDTPDE